MTPKAHFILVAAGQGTRFGAALPKQFLPLAGRTVLEHSLETLCGFPRINGGVVVLPKVRPTHWQCPDRVHTVQGGATRSASVRHGLAALDAAAQDWVLVHDAARPGLHESDLDRLFYALKTDPVGGLLALPISDSVKRAEAERVVGSVPRETLWLAQTPQMFRYEVLCRAMTLTAERRPEVTDEAQAVSALGLQPKLVQGHPGNLKITHHDDLALAAFWLEQRR